MAVILIDDPLPGSTNDTLALYAKLKTIADGDTVVFPAGKTFNLKTATNPDTGQPFCEFDISASNVKFIGNGCTIVQWNNQYNGFLKLWGSYCLVSDFTVRAAYDPAAPNVGKRIQVTSNTNPDYLGIPGVNKSSAVYVLGGHNVIRNLSVVNLFVGVCLRGPYETDVNGVKFDGLAEGNLITNLSTDTCDFCVTGSQQKGMILEKFHFTNGTNLSVPPHAVYLIHSRQPATGPLLSESIVTDSIIANFTVQNHPHDYAIKVKSGARLTIANFTVDNCKGGLTFNACDDTVVSNGTISGMPALMHGLFFSDCDGALASQIAISGLPGANYYGVRSTDGSKNIKAESVTVQTRYGSVQAQAPFLADGVRAYGVSELELINCTHQELVDSNVVSFRTIHDVVQQSFLATTAFDTPQDVLAGTETILVDGKYTVGKNTTLNRTLVNWETNNSNYDYKIETVNGKSKITLHDGPNLSPGEATAFTFYPVGCEAVMKVYKPAIDFPTLPGPAKDFLIDKGCTFHAAVETDLIKGYADTVYDDRGGFLTKVVVPNP